MADRSTRPSLIADVIVLAAFGWLAILIGLAPGDLRAVARPAPDLLFCVVAFLVIRRPSTTPAWLILGLGLVRDLAGGGPAGLGALTLWGAAEYLRFHRDRLSRSALAEAGMIAGLAFILPVIHLVTLTALFAPSPALSVLAAGAVATCLAYGATALIFRHVLRIRGEEAENLRLIGRAGRSR